VASGLGPLRHDHAGSDIDGAAGFVEISDLDDEDSSVALGGGGQRSGISEREHDGPGSMVESHLHQVFVHGPGQKADTPGLLGMAGDDGQLTR
jgi:hypothetical protein